MSNPESKDTMEQKLVVGDLPAIAEVGPSEQETEAMEQQKRRTKQEEERLRRMKEEGT